MARPEIVMETPAAKQLEAAVQSKLAEYSYSTADDVVMAEYVVVMLANAKTPAEITSELTELIGEDMYDPIFTDWLFEELERQYGTPTTQSVPPAETSSPEKQAHSTPPDQSAPANAPSGGKIETVNDSREPFSTNRNPLKRVPGGTGLNGTGGLRPTPGVFGQAVGGLKRSGGNDLLRDTPPHRRIRTEEGFSGGGLGGIPTGPRSMDRDTRDVGRPNVMPPRIGGGNNPLGDRRDGMNNNGPRLSHSNHYTPMRPGFGPPPDSGGKSILERAGLLGNGNRPFINHNNNFRGGFDNGPSRRMNEQLGDPLAPGPLAMPPAPFFNPNSAPFATQLPPPHPFSQHQFPPHQPPTNAPTPQLFLANGQPYIPPQQAHPLSGNPAIQPMYHQLLMNTPQTSQNQARLSVLAPTFNPGHQPQPLGLVSTLPQQQLNQSQAPDLNLSPLPEKPTLKQECKYNLECKDAWCPSSHCPPCGDPKSSMLLNFEACEKQLLCQDSGCPKAHVSPQQRSPKSSIRIPVITNALAPAPTAPTVISAPSVAPHVSPAPSPNLTPCRFGANCTRPDCHFTHPWSHINSHHSNGGAVRCKFGLACTRPNCHFQHPTKNNSLSSFRTPSKNISKTFNSQDSPVTNPNTAIMTATPGGIDGRNKLPPSKKFPPPTSMTTSMTNVESAAGAKTADDDQKPLQATETTAASVVPGVQLKPVLPTSNANVAGGKTKSKVDAANSNNGLPQQHQVSNELADIKPVLPSAIVS